MFVFGCIGKTTPVILDNTPLLMIKLNLISKAAKAPVCSGGFWGLLNGVVFMLMFGEIGENTYGFGWPRSSDSDRQSQSFSTVLDNSGFLLLLGIGTPVPIF